MRKLGFFFFICTLFAIGVSSRIAKADLIYSADFADDGQGFTHSTSDPIGPNGSFAGSNWIASYPGTPSTDSTTNEFITLGGAMRIQDWGGVGELASATIDVSGFNEIKLDSAVSQLGSGANTGSEYIQFFYQLDGGSRQYTVVDNSSIPTSNWSISSLDVSSVSNLVVGFEFNVNGSNDGWTVGPLTVDGLSAVPEPTSLAYGMLALTTLTLRRRRR